MGRPASTYGAFLLFFVAAFVTIGLCTSAAIKKRRVRSEQDRIGEEDQTASSSSTTWETMKRVLFGSLHWRAEGPPKGSWEEKGVITSTPPLWQRRIMMGERCEMPKFSGLILYDEGGRVLQGNSSNGVVATVQQEKTPPAAAAAAAVTATLRDLL